MSGRRLYVAHFTRTTCATAPVLASSQSDAERIAREIDDTAFDAHHVDVRRVVMLMVPPEPARWADDDFVDDGEDFSITVAQARKIDAETQRDEAIAKSQLPLPLKKPKKPRKP